MNRRTFIKTTAAAGAAYAFAPMSDMLARAAARRNIFLVLGIDGMDIHLARTFMGMGLLPNFSRLAHMGALSTSATSFPPQSPVAWSSFSVGAPPAVHGIYDFIHRDPATMMPYLSTSRVQAPEKTISIGGYEIPLEAGKVENLRHGATFWDLLAARDIPATIYKMPGNFPCRSDKVDMISGMGTPDLRGGYGSFTLATTAPPANSGEITGGEVITIGFDAAGYAAFDLPGPANTMRAGAPAATVPVRVWRDPHNQVARVVIDGHEFLLNKGDWSGWLRVSFPMIEHLSSVSGIVKLYIKSVHPEFSMYISPINIDPAAPALPIASTDAYSKRLAADLGPFYTQGMPEDTKALSYGVLDNGEYLDLAWQIIGERRAALNHELDVLARRDEGLLFFYFSSLDQDSHMFWRTIAPHSPLYTEELGREFGDTLRNLYIEMDHCLGDALERFDLNDPRFHLVVMSDHGFAPFRRQVNLNSWLREENFLALYGSTPLEEGEFFADVQWERTAAYALGINAIYLNLEGRERFGSLAAGRAASVTAKIKKRLLALRDPATGRKVVSAVYVPPAAEKAANPHAPDLIVGWNRGYRTSWSSILGGFENETIKDNDDRWSGDHCIDPDLVAAILFANRKIGKQRPGVLDITASILASYAITPAATMTGAPLFTA